MVSYSIPQDPRYLLTEQEAGLYLGLSPKTLRNQRVKGQGPDYVKLSARCVRYRLADLETFITSKHVGGDQL